MTKQTSTPATPVRRRRRAVLFGAAAAGLALAAVTGVTQLTPTSSPEAAEAPGTAGAATSAAPTSAPSADASAAPAAEPSAAPSTDAPGEGDQASEEAPEISDAVGVAPAAPAANDAELALVPQEENAAVQMGEEVQVIDGMTVAVSDLTAVTGVADEPGEVAGDAVKVSVTLTNTGSAEADTSGVVVDLEAGPDAIPGMVLRGSGTSFPASIASGESATAEYVFVVDPTLRSSVSVLVNYAVNAPIAVFEGTAPATEEQS